MTSKKVTTEETLSDNIHDLLQMVKYAKLVAATGELGHLVRLRGAMGVAISELDEMEQSLTYKGVK